MNVTAKLMMRDGQAYLELSPEILDALGVAAGDEVVLEVEERTLTVQSIEEYDRDALLERISDERIEKRRKVYEALTRGAE